MWKANGDTHGSVLSIQVGLLDNFPAFAYRMWIISVQLGEHNKLLDGILYINLIKIRMF